MYRPISRYILLLLTVAVVMTAGGVFAMWNYAELPIQSTSNNLLKSLNSFSYQAPEMPEAEVTLLQRLAAILNERYTNDGFTEEPREYLLHTLDKDWDTGINPASGSFFGNMDPMEDTKYRSNVMFGDITEASRVSFIIKSEDLDGDGYNEIALYSTSDPLDWYPGHNGIVGVYFSVFVPVFDDDKNIIAYDLLCESLHGYCIEVSYIEGDNTPSFSTDHWVDELFYWHHLEPYLRGIPSPDRYKYECYHTYYYPYEGREYDWQGWIEPNLGKTADQRLEEIFKQMGKK